jgi:hypothetical protein
MYAFGRFRVVRSFMVWAYSLRKTKQLADVRPTLVQDVDIDAAASAIYKDGFFPGLHLRKDVVEQLLTFSSMATCYADGNPDIPFRYDEKEAVEQQSGRSLKLGKYLHAFSASPVLQSLASDPQLRAIARKYLRTEPVLVSARMWWSFCGPTDAQQQMRDGQGFHYDIDGYRALAFFFYLTDVGPTNGPHVYVRGSHTRKLLRHIVSIYKGRSDAEIESVYGLEPQVVCCGPAGSGFAEDIFGFHKGQHPQTSDRLIVQLRFGLRDYGTGHND